MWMAKEYIDRERMIKCFCGHCMAEGTEDCIDCYDKKLIQNLPAADVRENVIRTQADRIRNMSDEELAKWLYNVCCIEEPFECPALSHPQKTRGLQRNLARLAQKPRGGGGMTQAEAIQNQSRLQSSGFDLGYWYGTECYKCHGVFPKFMSKQDNSGDCWYQCEVCGKRSRPGNMPWVARENWNNGLFQTLDQMDLFALMEVEE